MGMLLRCRGDVAWMLTVACITSNIRIYVIKLDCNVEDFFTSFRRRL